MSTSRDLPRSRAWLRALVLLLALLVPGAPAEVHAPPVVSTEIAEYDFLDTTLRPPARGVHRPAVPLRPAPAPGPASDASSEGRHLPAPPYAPHTSRSVVLRC